MDWLDTCPVVEFRDIVEKKSYTVAKVDEDSAVWIYTVDFAVVKEEDEEQGTVYTGDAPSTEASFYKKDKVNGATVIDLVIDLLKNGKVQQAIWELQDHRTTVQTEDLDNQAYSEGEGYR